ncbi:MAG: DUF1700 domain-containing protein [Clostridia bacterium]|nr:DUF1700 domain-containing protein [Clostridia bacterium]
MTYNEWKDELKSNLLCVSDSERRRVLDYYAEAYADRRDAGFTEREIIEDFGAPYDAAKRILSERGDDYYDEPQDIERLSKRDMREIEKRQKEEQRREEKAEREERRQESFRQPPPPYEPQPQPQPQPAPVKQRENLTWVFVLLCIIFSVPLFMLVMAMVGITIGFCVAPFGVMIYGCVEVVYGIIGMASADIAGGLGTLALGIIGIGVGIILIPLFIKLVGLMWKLFKMFFAWLKRLFSGKEANV